MKEKIVFAVITKVDPGDLGDELIFYDKKLKSWCFVPDNWKELELDPKKWKQMKVPAFELGEIVILDGDKWGRELDGIMRKPSKGDVEYECFTKVKDAIKKSREVLGYEL